MFKKIGCAYSRDWDYKTLRSIADEVNALLLADISHPSGLIASGILNDPLPYCHIVTSTTHKTLRGPRGGVIMMGNDFENKWGKVAPKSGRVKMVSELLDTSVMPGVQGGPLMHIIAAKAIAFGEALKPNFIKYAKSIISNAKTMAEELMIMDYNLITDGTDTHVILIDLTNKNISGKTAELILGKAGITVNKNMVPFDIKSPFVTSGIRIGTPAITTRGMGKTEMKQIASWIDKAINNYENDKVLSKIKNDVNHLCSNFPIYKH